MSSDPGLYFWGRMKREIPTSILYGSQIKGTLKRYLPVDLFIIVSVCGNDLPPMLLFTADEEGKPNF